MGKSGQKPEYGYSGASQRSMMSSTTKAAASARKGDTRRARINLSMKLMVVVKGVAKFSDSLLVNLIYALPAHAGHGG